MLRVFKKNQNQCRLRHQIHNNVQLWLQVPEDIYGNETPTESRLSKNIFSFDFTFPVFMSLRSMRRTSKQSKVSSRQIRYLIIIIETVQRSRTQDIAPQNPKSVASMVDSLLIMILYKGYKCNAGCVIIVQYCQPIKAYSQYWLPNCRNQDILYDEIAVL